MVPSGMPTRLAEITELLEGLSFAYSCTSDAGWAWMRWIHVVGMTAAAACGGKEQGALLVLDAPEGTEVSRIEIALASAETDDIVDVDGQRVEPSDLAMEPVRYYRQRAVTGAISEVGTLDGFQLRLEPNLDNVPEGLLIPFLIAYDADDRVAAIGAVLDAERNPTHIEIVPDQLARFDVAMQVLVETDGAEGIATNEAMAIDCEAFTNSGIAWQPGARQLRLLMADRSQDPEATDASERPLDMDCDGRKAFEDCDDLRSEFHPGAPESCDGFDHDCDFRPHELVACDLANPSACSAQGVTACVEASATELGCQQTPECACEGGACASCVIPFSGGDGIPSQPCDPAVETSLAIPDCNFSCEVEVLRRPGDPFRVEIAKQSDMVFGDKLVDVPDKIMVRVSEAEAVTAAPNDVIGGIFLLVTSPNRTFQLDYAVALAGQSTTCPLDLADMACTNSP